MNGNQETAENVSTNDNSGCGMCETKTTATNYLE